MRQEIFLNTLPLNERAISLKPLSQGARVKGQIEDDSLVQAGVFAFLFLSTTAFLGAGYFLLLKPVLTKWIF